VTKVYVALIAFIDSLTRRDQEGQGLAEYALIISLIAIVGITSLVFLGGMESKLLSSVGRSV
jgi:Flp pilus assembly pilin Flp